MEVKFDHVALGQTFNVAIRALDSLLKAIEASPGASAILLTGTLAFAIAYWNRRK